MDYLKIYNHFYNKTVYNTKCLILNYYKNSKNKKRPVTIVNNTVLKKLYDYRTEKYSNKLLKEFSAPFDVFQNRHMYYEGSEQDRIKWVLEEEVLHAFGSKNKSDYFSFIADLAVEQTLAEISRHFRNYYSYYELVYDLERYDYLCLKDFEGGSFENSIEYNDMVNVKYPDRDKNSATPEFVGFGTISDDDIFHEELLEISTLKSNLESFEDDEKLLLLHIMYKHREELKIPEFLRLHIITNGVFDHYIFRNKDYNNKAFYKKVEAGINYAKTFNLDFVVKLKNKLSSFNLIVTKSILKSLEHSLR
ncbi:hypothetical protein ACFQ0I_09590 [Mariniflexile aquimaris]|uniref:Phage protein n=1 Tax=Mariniflexile aquimaris TaxID=881009 RepID=A0ABW3BUI0_9FLAO